MYDACIKNRKTKTFFDFCQNFLMSFTKSNMDHVGRIIN